MGLQLELLRQTAQVQEGIQLAAKQGAIPLAALCELCDKASIV